MCVFSCFCCSNTYALTTMETRGIVIYLLSSFSLAILLANYLKNPDVKNSNYLQSNADKVWPELEFDWRIVVATLVGFLGSACGTVGGVGGGGIFVPMLTLVVGFDAKSAAAISKCMIMGASASSVWYNLRVSHPTKEVPILDYDLALLFQPMLMIGITIGVALSVVFPYWLITVLIIVLFIGTSSRSFCKAIKMWNEESVLKKELTNDAMTENSKGDLVIDTAYEPLVPKEEKSELQIVCFNLRWKNISALMIVWVSFLLIQIFKNEQPVCSTVYWVLFCLQFTIAVAVFGLEAVKLYRDYRKRLDTRNMEAICEASIQWTPLNITFCALCGIIGGTVGGLLGSGGGFILGPLLLEIGVIPQVASATATFVMMFSSSLSVVEFYLLNRFPISYAMYLMTVSVLAGFWGQFFVRKLVAILKRPSIIVFILSGVIFASALIMGVIGIENSIHMIHNHEFMGFLDFCSST